MVQHIEAVFEGGVLRPVGPVRLTDGQRVRLTVTDETGIEPVRDRQAEMEWIRKHAHEYRGLWLALDGERLVAQGPDGKAVYDSARAQGVVEPLMYRPPHEDAEATASFI